MAAMRCLIFGCGYLGQRVAKTWVDAGCEVYGVTRSASNTDAFRQVGIQPLVADICDPSSLVNLPSVDLVLHAIGFDRSSGKTQDEVTCGGTRNLLNAIKGNHERFIHISSTSVYGQSSGEWVDETSDCHPVQSGGQLALVAESLVREAHSSTETQSFVLRLAGIYGPGRLLSRIETLKSGQPLSGRGDAWLNLIHVDDAVKAIHCCTGRGVSGGTYIVSDDCPTARSDYFEELARLAGAPAPKFDANQASPRGSGGLNKRCSNKKARHELSWAPQFPSFKFGLPTAIHSSID